MNKHEKIAVEQMDALNNKLHEADYSQMRHYIYNKMVKLYEHYKIIQKLWELRKTWKIVERFIRRIPKIITNYGNIFFEENAPQYEKGTNQVYLIRIYGENNTFLWSKVGTTTRETVKRMKDHIRNYDNAVKIYVDRVWDCGDIDPEGLESEFRAYFIRKHKGSFIKNDRFANVLFDLNEADQIAANYLTNN